ncbi:MAG: CPBP family intramembrane metalloprotease [Firmicutes bacterium]|nr:CPBP family intramembrane metalloprotease [Bacillota bacterium]
MWPKNASISQIITYITVTLLLSIGTALLLNNNPEKFGALAGLWLVIPTMTAVTLNIIHHGGFDKVYSAVFTGTTKSSIIFAILYPLGLLLVLAVTALLTGLAEFNTGNLPTAVDLIKSLVNLLLIMIITFGEEYGWRGFLLPALQNRYDKIKAIILVGIIWALYQVPSIYLGANQFGSHDALTAGLVQGAHILTISFPLAYCYFLTKGSIIPIMLYRAVWSVESSLVLGEAESSHTLLVGNYTLFNGYIPLELILNTLAVFWFIKKLRLKSASDTD